MIEVTFNMVSKHLCINSFLKAIDKIMTNLTETTFRAARYLLLIVVPIALLTGSVQAQESEPN